MASNTFFLYSILLLLTLTSTTTAMITTTTTRTTSKNTSTNNTARNSTAVRSIPPPTTRHSYSPPSQPPPTVRNSTAVHSILPPTTRHSFSPPSQPPPTTAHHQAQLSAIIDAIIGAGDFSNWASLLAEADPSTIPLSATLFIPDDSAAAARNESSPGSNDPLLLPHHIVPRRFSFSELQLFPLGAKLPTLLPGTFLMITNNSAVNFTINGAKLIRPNLFQNAVVSVHGVEGFLGYANHAPQPPSSEQQAEFEIIGARARRRPRLPAVEVQPTIVASDAAENRSKSFSFADLFLSVWLILFVMHLVGLPTVKIEVRLQHVGHR